MPQLPFDLPLPGREQLLDHSVRYRSNGWHQRLPSIDWWPPALAVDGPHNAWLRLDRRQAFALAQTALEEDRPEHLLVAAGVFGTGDGPRARARFCRIFANEPAAISGRLRAGLRILANEGAVAAYRALTGEHHIPYLGPAFLTKTLYLAAGPDASPASPVILDKYVALALRAARCVPDRWPLANWSTQQYAAYLGLVHGWATEHGVGSGQIEMALFVRGRAQ